MSVHLAAFDDTGMPEGDQDEERYEFRVGGHLGPMMLSAFDGLDAENGPEDYTLLRGDLQDQAAVHGVLNQIEALGLKLLEVRRLPRS